MLFLDYQDRRPIYEQIVEKFRLLILSGAMEPDSRMPSVRQLAMELSINPNTIQRSYRELEKLGLVNTVAGKGAFAATDGTAALRWREELMAMLSSTLRELKLLGVSESELQSMVLAVFRKEDET